MDRYAKNFHLKNGRELGEQNLVWAATIHQERKNRGTDEGGQDEKKDGLPPSTSWFRPATLTRKLRSTRWDG